MVANGVMAHYSSVETTTMVDILHAEERRLVEALSAVRAKLNDLAPISALPAEVLECIFEICVSWLYEYRRPQNRLAWTQVCRKWRSVSLSAARLWRCIDLSDSLLTDEFLLRSGSAPIHLISTSTSPPRLCIGDLEPHAERVQTLDVHFFPEDLINLFASLGPDLVNLASLSLKVPPVSTSIVLDIKARVPGLRRLALEGVAIPWHLCVSLTHLSLRGLGAGYSPSINELLTIFKSSPNLEYLRLQWITPSSDLPISSLDHQIPLPCLRELFVAAKAPVILFILSNIYLPSAPRLQVNCSDPFESLSDFLPADLRTTYSALDVHGVRLEREGVRFFPSAGLADLSDSIISFGSSWPILKAFLPDVPQFFSLAHVTVLELGREVLLDLPRPLLSQFLVHLPALEDLRVAFGSSFFHDLFFTLSRPRSGSDSWETPGRDLLCPGLRTISFGGTRDQVAWYFEEKCIPRLLALAKARHAAGVPLEDLRFMRCHTLSPGVFEDFAGLVGRISVSAGEGRDGEVARR
ncbi:putative F-box-like [Lyophyllum shimeji]|uniref:F-box-like n=1 Tax=Lyophyllum shimeji TaxID=47721 RepID=A0A9P3ULG7_LYOSH|nr:putative F-box-like [Lyophyllum shimeji]